MKWISKTFVAPVRHFRALSVTRAELPSLVSAGTAAPAASLALLPGNGISLNTSMHLRCDEQSSQGKTKQLDVGAWAQLLDGNCSSLYT